MAFRANFLVKMLVEMLWLGILLVFYQMIFADEHRCRVGQVRIPVYVGCHFTLAGIIETFFLSNCVEFADLIRSGDLDHYLLKPIDEHPGHLPQPRLVDAAQRLRRRGRDGFALGGLNWTFDPVLVLAFLVVFGCGVGMTYSFLLLLTSTSVWFVRNQNLMELWWLFTTLMRYPREIYKGTWATPSAGSSRSSCRCCWSSTCRPTPWSASSSRLPWS